MTKDVIRLAENLIIGKGRDRICYEHPTQTNLCIKISFNSNKQSIREVKYFNYLTQKNKDLSHISRFVSMIDTDKGDGYVFELIRNDNQQVSKTLRQCLESNVFSLEYIRPKLIELKNYLITNEICVRDISPSNICCKETTTGFKLYIIDGVSNPTINPLNIRIRRFINASIDKAWLGLERKLIRIEKSLTITNNNETNRL